MGALLQENMKIETVHPIISRLTSAKWFHKVGLKEAEIEEQMEYFLKRIQVSNYKLRWIHKKEVVDAIGQLNFQGSELWEKLANLPEELKAKISLMKQDDELKIMVDIVPEAVFHTAFAGAIQQFNNQKVVEFLTCIAMYLTIMACTVELADAGELFYPILQIVEEGHAPIGIDGNTILLL